MSMRAPLVLALVAGVAVPLAARADTASSPTAGETANAATSSSTKSSKKTAKTTAKKTAKPAKPAKKTAKKATSSKSSKSSRKSRSSKHHAKATSKSKKKKKNKNKKNKEVAISRTPTKSSLRDLHNMPRGYAWPPTAQMEAAERVCEARLDELGITWKRADREGRIVAPLTVTDDAGAMSLGGITYTSAWRKGPHKLDCQLALALEQFGRELHDIGVRNVKFGSIFRWTNVRVNGKTKNMLSRHALGIAMDIVSFTDATGREIVVEKDYASGDPVLLAVEAAVNSSPMFRVLLTPRNDPRSHHDHFHIEVAVDYTKPDKLIAARPAPAAAPATPAPPSASGAALSSPAP